MNGTDVNELHTLLPLAVGMLLSPLPIVAVVAILLSPRGRACAPVYTAAFTLVSVAVVGLGAAGAARASSAKTRMPPRRRASTPFASASAPWSSAAR